MYKDKNKPEEKDLKTDSPVELEKKTVEETAADPLSGGGKDDDLRKLIEKNIKWSQIIYEQNKKIKNRLTLMVLGSYLRIFLILAPIIIAIFFLPPFINQIMKNYGFLPGQTGSSVNIMDEFNKIMQNNTNNQPVKPN